MSDCIFCKIAKGEIPAKIAYQNDQVVAFHDLSPQAPCHILVIPRKHIGRLDELGAADGALVGEMMLAATEIARQQGIAESGYRTVMNCNADGGQTVFHIHLHLLGGRQMKWPPG